MKCVGNKTITGNKHQIISLFNMLHTFPDTLKTFPNRVRQFANILKPFTALTTDRNADIADKQDFVSVIVIDFHIFLFVMEWN